MARSGSRRIRPLAAVRGVAVRGFERLTGLRTQGDVLSSGWIALWAIFRRLEVSRDDVFVDLGSGKGRVLYMAARRPFKRVIGVEWDERFNEIARANLARTERRLRAGEVEILRVDIRDWEVPDDLTVAYLHTPFPFEPEALDRLVERLNASARRNPRTLRFICLDPLPEHLETPLAEWRIEPLRDLAPRAARGRFPERACIATLEPAVPSGRRE